MKKITSQKHRKMGVKNTRLVFCWIILLFIYIISTIYWYSLGIRFETLGIRWFPHYIPVDILKEDLWGSIWNIHIQPFLFNLFIGIVVKCFNQPELFLNIIYQILNVVLISSMFLLLVRLGVHPFIGIIFVTIFALSPSNVLFSNYPFYTFPLVTLLLLSALFLNQLFHSNNILYAFLFFFTLSIIVAIRSLFHPLWYLFILIILLYLKKNHWRKILLASLIPFFIIIFAYGKNLYLFGTFSGSSWLGFSLAKMTTFMLPEEKRIDLVKQGVLTELSLIGPLNNPWRYREFAPAPPRTGVKALDSAETNTNNILMIDISNKYLKDATIVLKKYPETYFRAVKKAFKIYFFPSSEYFLYNNQPNKKILYKYEKIYNTIIYGQINIIIKKSDPMDLSNISFMSNPLNIGFFILFGFVLSLVYSTKSIITSILNKNFIPSYHGTILFIISNIIFVTLCANLLEVGENNRFRYMIEPYICIILALIISDLYNRVKCVKKKSRHK